MPEDQNRGILPKLIATLVSRRKQVKSLMKDKKATPDQLATWDIKQLALKLTANSMYGCLGYTQSRFYARPLAMLTTFKGREILRSTKDLAESAQLRVIYGDTDSVMINTNADSVEEALKVGRDFKRSVNERYKLLEIDIDNVFRRLLLHAKKKYAAINMLEIGGKYVDKLEVKGLDMKRREYCALSKEASSKLLNEILSGEDPEVVVKNIHDYLRELSEKMREEKIPAQKYIIFTVSFRFSKYSSMLIFYIETWQKPQRLPKPRQHAASPSSTAIPRSRQISSCQRCNLLHNDLCCHLKHLDLRPGCKTSLRTCRRHIPIFLIKTRYRMVSLQADIPPHRASLRAHPRNRLSAISRMPRSRHPQIFHQLLLHLQRNARNLPARKPDPRLHPLQRRRAPLSPLPLLQIRIRLRRPRRLHRPHHPSRHRLPHRLMQTHLLHPHRRRPTRARHPRPDIHLLRRLAHLRRLMRHPHAPNERLRPPLPRTRGPRNRLLGPHALRILREGPL